MYLVAHNLGEIEASCNRVIWLEKGEIVMQGDDVPGIIDAYLEATGGEPRRRDLPHEVTTPRADPADGSGASSVRRGREPQPHGRAATGPRAPGDLAVLGLGQAADDEQADAHAAEPAAVARLALVEPAEDALVIADGDADALVFHRDIDPAPPRPGPYQDDPAVG